MIKSLSLKTIPQHCLVLMVGPSGSGKSTLAAKYFNAHEIISSDAIRIELVGTLERQDINDIVFGEVARRASIKLTLGERVVIDATNLRKKDRLEASKVGRNLGVPVYYLVWNRPLHEKLVTQGWREEVTFNDGTNLVQRQESMFKSNEREILSGDGVAEVIDARTMPFEVVNRPPTDNLINYLKARNFSGVTAVADIHGMKQSMKSAIQWAQQRNHFIVFLGDIIDYGMFSLDCARMAYELVADAAAVMCEGNHEFKIRRWLDQRFSPEMRLRLSGGNLKTVDAFNEMTVPEQNRWEFQFRSLLGMSRHHWQIGNCVFAHGAVGASFYDNHRYKLVGEPLNLAYFGQVDKVVNTRDDGFPNRIYDWVDELPDGCTAVVGHDIRSTQMPVTQTGKLGGNAIFLDTGCGKGGSLSSADFVIEDDNLKLTNFNRH